MISAVEAQIAEQERERKAEQAKIDVIGDIEGGTESFHAALVETFGPAAMNLVLTEEITEGLDPEAPDPLERERHIRRKLEGEE